MKKARHGLTRLQAALLVTVLAVSAGGGAYAVMTLGSQGNDVQIQITETDPANQVDSFVPQNVTVKQGLPVAIVVHNGDDENRVFTISGFNFNLTISPHTAQRGTFTPNATGTFLMYSPQTKPSAASHGKPGTACTGYLTVTP